MKTLLGIVIGALLVFGATVYADGNALSIVNSITVGGEYDLYKVYDTDNGAVCYVVTREFLQVLGSGDFSMTSSISCFKN